jgi:uncharacterized protein (TIGR02453 family)
MKYFSNSFFKFFDELTKNNNKEWFEKNRPVYESEIKAPFRKLVEDLTEKLSKDFPEVNRDATKAIFRINRDVRFAKDKSPYKNNVAAIFSRNGKKDEEYPGFYIHFGSKELMIGGGKYFCSKEDVAKIRQEIYYNNNEFKKILNDSSFKTKFKTLAGDKSKILDPEYKEFTKEQPLVANKNFWYHANLTRKDITSDKLDTLVLSYFKAGLKVNRFLWEAISQ